MLSDCAFQCHVRNSTEFNDFSYTICRFDSMKYCFPERWHAVTDEQSWWKDMCVFWKNLLLLCTNGIANARKWYVFRFHRTETVRPGYLLHLATNHVHNVHNVLGTFLNCRAIKVKKRQYRNDNTKRCFLTKNWYRKNLFSNVRFSLWPQLVCAENYVFNVFFLCARESPPLSSADGNPDFSVMTFGSSPPWRTWRRHVLGSDDLKNPKQKNLARIWYSVTSAVSHLAKSYQILYEIMNLWLENIHCM